MAEMPEPDDDEPCTTGRDFDAQSLSWRNVSSPDPVLSRAEAQKLENLVGHKFDLDGSTGSQILSQGTNCCDVKTLMTRDLGGKHVFVWPKPTEIGVVIAHYQQCKGSDPEHGSLCIVVPERHESEWLPKLDGFQFLTDYSVGTKVLEERYASGIAVKRKLPLGMQVFYDGAPLSQAQSEVDSPDGTLKMRCVRQVASHRASILLDSGATGNYISKEFACMLGIQLPKGDASEDHVVLPDGRMHAIHGTVKLRVKLQRFCEQVDVQLLNLHIPFDVILVNVFLSRHKAILNYYTGSICLWKGRRTFVLKPAVGDSKDSVECDAPASGGVNMLSALQAKRAMRRTHKWFLCLVNHNAGEPPTQVGEGSSSPRSLYSHRIPQVDVLNPI